jgi:hypothetical protein
VFLDVIIYKVDWFALSKILLIISLKLSTNQDTGNQVHVQWFVILNFIFVEKIELMENVGTKLKGNSEIVCFKIQYLYMTKESESVPVPCSNPNPEIIFGFPDPDKNLSFGSSDPQHWQSTGMY